MFDCTDRLGVSTGQAVTVPISAADHLVDLTAAELRALIERDLARLLPRTQQADVVDFFVTREREATFRPESRQPRAASRHPYHGWTASSSPAHGPTPGGPQRWRVPYAAARQLPLPSSRCRSPSGHLTSLPRPEPDGRSAGMTIASPMVLSETRDLVLPALRAAVDQLDPTSRAQASYHLCWTDAEGNPEAGPGRQVVAPGARPALRQGRRSAA